MPHAALPHAALLPLRACVLSPPPPPPHVLVPRRYTGTFAKAPQDTQPCLKAGGGYWIPQRDAMKPVPPKFVATTTYKAEMLNGEATAASQLERSEGLRCTLSPYEAARSA